ncbi:MAG: STAS domain-containing protein [Candidatus Tectimicrobiota bacterium]
MLQTLPSDNSVLITPATDIVASQVQDLRAALCEAIDQGARHIVLDLQAVEMVDSAGLGVLISAQNTLHEHGGGLTVRQVSPDLLRLFQLMRLDKHFTVTARADA